MSLVKPHGPLDQEPLMAMIADLISANEVLHQSHPITWEYVVQFSFLCNGISNPFEQDRSLSCHTPCSRQD